MSDKTVTERLFDKLDDIKDDLHELKISVKDDVGDLRVKVSAIATHQKIQWWVIGVLTGLCTTIVYLLIE